LNVDISNLKTKTFDCVIWLCLGSTAKSTFKPTDYNLSDFNYVFQIILDNNILDTFPVEDFCLYKAFPFNQLILIVFIF